MKKIKYLSILFAMIILLSGCGKTAESKTEEKEPEQIQEEVPVVDNDIMINQDTSIEINSKATLYSFVSKDNKVEITSKDKTINTSKLGTQKLTIKFKVDEEEKEKEFEIQIVDTTSPSITGVKDLSTTTGKKINLLANIKVTDNSKEKITAKVEGEYDFNKEGTYKLKYVATDSSNNKKEEEFVLKVVNSSTSNSNSTANNNTNNNTNNNSNNNNTTNSNNDNSSNNNTEQKQESYIASYNKTPDYKITKYDMQLNLKLGYPSQPIDLTDYKGELMYKFNVPIVVDSYGNAAFSNWMPAKRSEVYIYAKEAAKKNFGEDVPYCVAYASLAYAFNKDLDVVGIVGIANIGIKDTFDSCSVNNKTIFLNNQITVIQDKTDGSLN